MLATLACLLVTQSPATDVPVLLRRDVGHAYSHAFWMSYRMQLDMAGIPGMGEMGDKPLTMNATFREQLTPMRGNKARVKITVTDMKMQLPMGAEQPPLTTKSMSMVLDSLNRVKFDKGSFAKMGPSSMFSTTENPFGSPLAFPEKPVRFGDSWAGGTMGGAFGDGVTKMTTTYLGEEESGGVPCYRLMTSVDMDLGKMMGKMVPGSSEGGNPPPTGFMTLTGYIYISKNDGSMVSSYLDGVGKVTISAQGQQIKMNMGMSLDLKRVR